MKTERKYQKRGPTCQNTFSRKYEAIVSNLWIFVYLNIQLLQVCSKNLMIRL